MQFKKNVIGLYGQPGQEWLDNLPNLVNQLADHWNLSNLQVLPSLSYNYVLSCFQNKKPVILKVGFCKKELQAEANALRAFAGHGCIKLLDHNVELGALLLQRAVPGTTLKSTTLKSTTLIATSPAVLNSSFPEQDEHAVKIISNVIKALQSAKLPSVGLFPDISVWLAILDTDWNIPQKYLAKARNLREHLLSTSINKVLLHGDLHHENILWCGQDKWIAIDPKGVIGDPVFEVGASIRNPIPDLLKNNDVSQIIQNRINIFSEQLNVDYKRIFDWVYIQSVMCACWAMEDNADIAYIFKFLEILEEI
jgi:streptomycin 6-kinase